MSLGCWMASMFPSPRRHQVVCSTCAAPFVRVSFLPEGDRATQIVIRRVGVTYKVITLDGSEQKKQQIVAATLALLFGALGAHKFYLGYNTQGTILFLMGTLGWFLLVPPLASFLIGLIEGVIYFRKNEQEFYDTYEAKQRAWF